MTIILNMITNQFKNDFPVFGHNPNLIYLDSTATSLKPKSVIIAINDYNSKYSSNIHRGLYPIAQKANYLFEKSRETVASFINASSKEEVIFTRSTTESINLVAYGLGRILINSGDEIVTTIMEHHSNFVPWQVLATENGAVFKVIDITDDGKLAIINSQIQNSKFKIQNENSKFKINLEKIITKKTKILALTYVSNVFGVVNPVKEIIKVARKINPNIIVVIDAAQASPHHQIDVVDLDCDFLAFSSHKMLGPTGAGVLWGRKKILENMAPFNFGGDMIE